MAFADRHFGSQPACSYCGKYSVLRRATRAVPPGCSARVMDVLINCLSNDTVNMVHCFAVPALLPCFS